MILGPELGNPCHIVHLISGLGVGGAEKTLVALTQRLVRSRFRSSVISLSTLGNYGSWLNEEGIPTYALGMHRRRPSIAGFIRLHRLLRQLQPDLIQTWMYHADLYGLFASRGLGKPLVWNVRGSGRTLREFGLATGMAVGVCAALSPIPATVVVNSRRGLRDHQRMGYRPRRWEVIPNGVDLGGYRRDPASRGRIRARLSIRDGHVLAGTVARFHPFKGHAALIEAVGRVKAEHPELRLLLVGRGTEAENETLQAMIQRAGISDRVRLLGERGDVPEILQALDLFVLPSYSGEGFPNALLEAMAVGMPCLVTEVGDSAVIVDETGVVVPPRDPGALAEGLKRLLAMSPEERRRLGLAAHDRVRSRFSIETMVHSYADLYSSLVGN